MSDGGKGSKQRPSAVASEEFASNWNRIFASNKSVTPKEAPAINTDTPAIDRWKPDGIDIHNGNCYYRCSICNVPDWIPGYGLKDQLICNCK